MQYFVVYLHPRDYNDQIGSPAPFLNAPHIVLVYPFTLICDKKIQLCQIRNIAFETVTSLDKPIHPTEVIASSYIHRTHKKCSNDRANNTLLKMAGFNKLKESTAINSKRQGYKLTI